MMRIIWIFLLLLINPIMGLCLQPGSVVKADVVISSLIKRDFKQAGVLFKEEPELLYTPNSSGITPLILAVNNDDNEMFHYLLNLGAPISSPFYEKPLLVYGLYANSQIVFRDLLEIGADADVNYKGESLLHLCVLLDRAQIMKILLQYNIDTDQIDPQGLTPLYTALLKDKWDFIKELAPITHNFNTVDKNKSTPLLYLINSEPKKLSQFLSLINEKYLNSVLNYQTKTTPPPLLAAIDSDNIDSVNILLQQGAKIDIQWINDKTTPLIKAVISENKDIIKSLLLFSPNLKLKDKNKKTALDYAKDNSSILELLNGE